MDNLDTGTGYRVIFFLFVLLKEDLLPVSGINELPAITAGNNNTADVKII